jgi:site-specific DNA recombinase
MKKAIRYLRYSHDGQSQHSIERQDMITAEWNNRNKIEVVDTFIDEGYSARNFDRPDIKALFSFIKKNHRHINYLVVAELTRFSREAGDAINMVKEIQNTYGVNIVSASRGTIYDVLDSNSFFMMGLEFLLGNSENIKRQADINGGIYTAKAGQDGKGGRWIQGGPAPFGFSKVGTGKERKLVVNEAEAVVVRFIYESFLNNNPVYLILKQAKTMGYKRRSNGSVQDILRNPLYMGYQQVKPWKEHAGGLFPLRDFTAIIDQSTWYRVQDRFVKKNPRKSIDDNLPLRGVLKCHCRKTLTGAASRSRNGSYINYYKCQVSGHNTINATHAHAQLEEILSLLSLPQRMITAIQTKSEELMETRMKDNFQLITTHKRNLENTETKLKSVEEKFILNQVNFETYDRLTRQLSSQRINISASLKKMEQDEQQVFFLLRNNLDKLGDLSFFWHRSSTQHKQELLRQVFDNGLYYRKPSYRTGYLMPVFTHNIVTLNQKQLLFVDDMREGAGEVEVTSPLSNQFIQLLSFMDSAKIA